ncbi:hypothetical protein BJ878DRAFT_313638 [Calycina marina]|uniref:Translation initiation factor 3 N-terminal domain-containing protein n=1 Tax=Calycina marina TaxID=1763456 RepID=A0A9P8CGC1_9HELO|nr:hypothetical protein BJ878DRAFT_313638 [Calycina marina]
MRSSRHSSSIANALHRVFIAPIEATRTSQLPSSGAAFLSTRNAFLPQRRTYISDSTKKAEKSRFPRNDEIKDFKVRLVEDSGSLSEPTMTRYLLSTMDPKTHNLVVVQPASFAGEPPICKLIDKKSEYLHHKQSQKKKPNPANTTKTIELNWAVDPNDLSHRMKRMREFLGKGYKLEVMLAPKRKGRQASEEECREVVQRVREVVGEVKGAKEGAKMEGKVGGALTMYFEGHLISEKEKEREVERLAKEDKAEAEKVKKGAVAKVESAAAAWN